MTRPRLRGCLVVAGLLLTGCSSAGPTATPGGQQLVPSFAPPPVPTALTGPTALDGPAGLGGPSGPSTDTPAPPGSPAPVPGQVPGQPPGLVAGPTDGAVPTGAAIPGEQTTPRSAVPANAVLRAADLGAAWTDVPTAALRCPAPPSVATRSASYAASRAALTETVSTVRDQVGTVGRWRTSMSRCGLAVQDYPLGEAGLIGTRGGEQLVVVAAEGVLVVLQAQAVARGTLDGYADLALGSSCPAAPDGCH